MTPPPKLSRRSEISPFLAMDALREAKELERAGRRIIHMELGEPGAPTPQTIRQAGVSALSHGQLGYGEALGHRILREEIARFYKKKYDIEISPDRVVITTGSSGAFLLALIAGFDPGARIAVTQPGYPAYTNILSALGLKTAQLRLSFENDFTPTASMLAALHKEEKLQGALLMNPANPTGTMISNESLADICHYCDLENITFISDEIYHGLEYEKNAQSALCFSEKAIIVNSFSKYYAMTGWRLGWIVAPTTWVRALERLQQSLAICPPTLSQTAALAAFSAHEEVEDNRLIYARNRHLLLDRLPAMGLTRFAPPDGAFYFYVDVSRFTRDSLSFCRRLLMEAGVAVTPGVDFDPQNGGSWIRLSYAGPEAEVAEGVARLANWLAPQIR
ncbi:MAG: pyridoxal phosphate-dependent aminotransferase [Methylocystis sp.]